MLGVGNEALEGLDALGAKVALLREKISKHPDVSTTLKSLVAGEPIDAPALQRQLAPGEVVVEYFSTGKGLTAFVIGASTIEAVALPVQPTSLTIEVSAFLRDNAEDAEMARSLHDTLVAPITDRVRSAAGDQNTPRVLVVPWGPLHRLPFEALRHGNRYLLETWDLSYLPSATVLKYLPRAGADAASSLSLVAFVDPDTDYNGDGRPDYPGLPFAQVEVDRIVPYFGKHDLLQGGNAIEEKCVRLVRGGQVVHFACHGEFFPSRPMDSTLYLSRGENSDGRLKAVEVFGLDLKRAHLVTLSGCETGRLEFGPGDDPVGIGTAFLHSGARTLVVSLWKVEDEATAELMQKFYETWLDKKVLDRASALRLAKLSMIREGRFKRPRQWAGFVLLGRR
jgi:CHAT domain-containing protein